MNGQVFTVAGPVLYCLVNYTSISDNPPRALTICPIYLYHPESLFLSRLFREK